jgi:hypothetical protein
MPRNTKRVREEDVDRKVVFMVRDKRFIVLRSRLQVQPPACTVWHELDTKWGLLSGFWVGAGSPGVVSGQAGR